MVMITFLPLFTVTIAIGLLYQLKAGPKDARHGQPHNPSSAILDNLDNHPSWHSTLTMAPADEKAESASEHEADLSAILSAEEQVELTLLIANITELMRKHITDTFDASITSAKKPQQALHTTDKNPNVDDSKPYKETEEEEKARKMREKRVKELSAPKMLELKNAYLDFFDKWRESVISRVGAVVNSTKEVIETQKEKATVAATPDRAAPAEPKVIRKPFCLT
jgi:hypothetical protein